VLVWRASPVQGVPQVASPQIGPVISTPAPQSTTISPAATAIASARSLRMRSWMPAAIPQITPKTIVVQANGTWK